MNIDDLVKLIQQHFTDGLVLVVGSGLSAAEGMPRMSDLAEYLNAESAKLSGENARFWRGVVTSLDAGEGLETALLKHPPPESLEIWIAEKTCELLMPKEREIMGRVIKGEQELRLTTFLWKVLKPANGLPILTPNYDRLIELACEMAAFHVDTTAVGHYAGTFDAERSCMGSARGITTRGKTTLIDHFPRAIVLKPHGSFDWFRNGTNALRCSVEIEAERLIITPGLNKYKAGYSSPFDKHRELANNHIDRAARLLVVGYGFNDDHLQTHLEKRIREGTPTLILTRTAGLRVQNLAAESPKCVCLAKPAAGPGTAVFSQATKFEQSGDDLWDLGVLAKELLS
ncbi:MAG TPA: SIR2 family protein [Edaphobacter sp.]|uniref:SIR2 family protein n=1 Tax=Edaphobacter sp. TaxID=1934404 RepID=UPI002BF70304|nr:SIR2 family protein [Edaphobacter sp.]HUZ94376.1 SIR2 family protein [Edaphobacter sp.]